MTQEREIDRLMRPLEGTKFQKEGDREICKEILQELSEQPFLTAREICKILNTPVHPTTPGTIIEGEGEKAFDIMRLLELIVKKRNPVLVKARFVKRFINPKTGKECLEKKRVYFVDKNRQLAISTANKDNATLEPLGRNE